MTRTYSTFTPAQLEEIALYLGHAVCVHSPESGPAFVVHLGNTWIQIPWDGVYQFDKAFKATDIPEKLFLNGRLKTEFDLHSQKYKDPAVGVQPGTPVVATTVTPLLTMVKRSLALNCRDFYFAATTPDFAKKVLAATLAYIFDFQKASAVEREFLAKVLRDCKCRRDLLAWSMVIGSYTANDWRTGSCSSDSAAFTAVTFQEKHTSVVASFYADDQDSPAKSAFVEFVGNPEDGGVIKDVLKLFGK